MESGNETGSRTFLAAEGAGCVNVNRTSCEAGAVGFASRIAHEYLEGVGSESHTDRVPGYHASVKASPYAAEGIRTGYGTVLDDACSPRQSGNANASVSRLNRCPSPSR